MIARNSATSQTTLSVVCAVMQAIWRAIVRTDSVGKIGGTTVDHLAEGLQDLVKEMRWIGSTRYACSRLLLLMSF